MNLVELYENISTKSKKNKNMIKKCFSAISSRSKGLSSYVNSTKSFLQSEFVKVKENLKNLRHNLKDIVKSNLDLGVYHLRLRNYNDAIIRFKLVIKFLDQDNKLAKYWLGWVYFMKKDYEKAERYLKESKQYDEIKLLSFIKNIDNITHVPVDIYTMHRDIMADLIMDQYSSVDYNILTELVTELNFCAEDLPDEYSILELGSNIGVLGREIRDRMQESFYITAVEPSRKMLDIQEEIFADESCYDYLFNMSVDRFLEENKNQYDVIYSLNGFSNNADLSSTFSKIYETLSDGGYFAFVVKIENIGKRHKDFLEFSYNSDHIQSSLKEVGFDILSAREFLLEIKNNYSIFICTK